jgi:2Fe-2S ferredoxin
VVKIVFEAADGDPRTVEAAEGQSVMLAAVSNGVPGIIGECGGNMSCATCHVWVSSDFQDLVGPPEEMEDDLLELGVAERRPCSRLSCQIEVSAALDGLVVEVPPPD